MLWLYGKIKCGVVYFVIFTASDNIFNVTIKIVTGLLYDKSEVSVTEA